MESQSLKKKKEKKDSLALLVTSKWDIKEHSPCTCDTAK